MIYIEVINHMTADELRAYAIHNYELLESERQLRYAFQELSRSWKQIAIDLEYVQDSFLKRNTSQDALTRLETELEKKYDQYIPRPVCGHCEE